MRNGDTDRILREFIAQTGVTFLVVRDSDGGYSQFRRALVEPAVAPFPLDVIVDPEGRLVSVRGEYDPEALDRDLRPFVR